MTMTMNYADPIQFTCHDLRQFDSFYCYYHYNLFIVISQMKRNKAIELHPADYEVIHHCGRSTQYRPSG